MHALKASGTGPPWRYGRRTEPWSAIGAITGEAERRLRISRKITERSIRVALSLDSNLDADSQREFLSRVLTPPPRLNPPEGSIFVKLEPE